MRQAEKAHGNDDSSVRPLAQRKMYRIRRQRQLLSFPLYRLVQTEVCNISGTSYHKALCSIRMFPHPFRLHAHWHRRVAFFILCTHAYTLCTRTYTHNAQPPIRIFARLYIRLCTRIYTEMHGLIYGNVHSTIRFSWRPDPTFFVRIAAWFTLLQFFNI